MTIDNHCGRDDQIGTCPASHAEAHSRIALEQSALFAAQLAIARWASAQPAPAMAQAQWYGDAQQNLQQWLARGGFAQDDGDCPDLVAPTMYSLNQIAAPLAASGSGPADLTPF